MEILKISSKSNPNSVAGAIAGLVKEVDRAEMQAIGAGALNQAVKAVAIARGFVAPAGVAILFSWWVTMISGLTLRMMSQTAKRTSSLSGSKPSS